MPWLDFAQTGTLVVALLLAAFCLYVYGRHQQVANLIQLTKQHRELWERMHHMPSLARILNPRANIRRKPVSSDEELFMVFVILHLSDTFSAIRAGFFKRPTGLRKDVQRFFSLPIPRVVWEKMKDLQEGKFVRFVESCLAEVSLDEKDPKHAQDDTSPNVP